MAWGRLSGPCIEERYRARRDAGGLTTHTAFLEDRPLCASCGAAGAGRWWRNLPPRQSNKPLLSGWGVIHYGLRRGQVLGGVAGCVGLGEVEL